MRSTGATADGPMKTLPTVLEAKALLDEAQGWWAWTWASEENKKRVRSAIENATHALEREVAKATNSRKHPLDMQAARRLKIAEAEFKAATALAKRTLDQAEKELNAAKAREGALQAKEAIEKHEVVWKLAALRPRQIS